MLVKLKLLLMQEVNPIPALVFWRLRFPHEVLAYLQVLSLNFFEFLFPLQLPEVELIHF